MKGVSYSLEVSEMVVTKCRNPNETDEGTPPGSSNDASNSNVSMESLRMGSRPCSKSATGPERNKLLTYVQAGSGLLKTPCP